MIIGTISVLGHFFGKREVNTLIFMIALCELAVELNIILALSVHLK